MSRTWKWILGIVLGLVILVGLGFVAANFFGYGHMSLWGRPMMGGYGFSDRGPADGFWAFRHPMMGGRGFGRFGLIGLPFLFFGGLLRLIFPLGVLALVAYFSYRAGKQAGLSEVQAPSAPEPENAE